MRLCNVYLMACVLMAASAQASTRRTELLSNLPLRFEGNRGPLSSGGAQYVARGANYVVSLAATENFLEWNDPARGKTARVRTRLAGANRNARLEPLDRLPGSANYFLGAAESWRTSVTGYGRIRYREVYAGIDLVFHGEQGRLEYDFLVAPHADPRAIRLELSGHRGLRIDRDGGLVISTAAGEVRWKRPEIYQEYGETRRPVTGQFVLSGRRTVAFETGAYDPGRTLVIDPTLSYSTFLGGSGNDFARGIGIDGAGNVYIAGGTSSSNLTPLSAVQPTFGGRTANPASGDAFVAKFSPAGALVYLTYLGGSADDTAMALAVDAAGNAYITGFTTSQNFPMAGTPFQSGFGGLGGSTVLRTGDAFVAKLNPSGNRLIYSTYLGGNLDDFGLAIAVDSTGAAYVTGGTTSVNFPTTAGAYQTKFQGKRRTATDLHLRCAFR